ncbi:MAG TPA: hypothetical protein VLN59_02270 [Burkholderiales bacterium]|nr:hypothetical protein [Burkholderiales bacterium]
MRIFIGKLRGTEAPQRERRSYLDAADDIVSLPLHELKEASVYRLSNGQRPAWPEECPKDRVTEFLKRVYALATQI